MSRQCPRDPTILQLLSADLAGESAIRFVEDVLRRNLDAFAKMFAGKQDV